MVFQAIVIILCFTAGTALIMWLGEQINDKGIGNGISIILFAGIVSRIPALITQLFRRHGHRQLLVKRRRLLLSHPLSASSLF